MAVPTHVRCHFSCYRHGLVKLQFPNSSLPPAEFAPLPLLVIVVGSLTITVSGIYESVKRRGVAMQAGWLLQVLSDMYKGHFSFVSLCSSSNHFGMQYRRPRTSKKARLHTRKVPAFYESVK